MTIAILLAASLLLVDPAAAPSATAPTPAASPAAPKQLKEIGRVRVSVCANIVVHANGAISSALKNDSTMSNTVTRLRSMDLESDPMSFYRGISDLDQLAGQLHDNAVHGAGEVQRLRDLAKGSKDAQRKADLDAFADALGGALYRQKRAAADLSGFIAYLRAQDMRKTPELDKMIAQQRDVPAKPTPADPPLPLAMWSSGHGSPNDLARAAAADFTGPEQEIALDEGTAADHAEGAVSGC
jgi:hypothetical protein